MAHSFYIPQRHSNICDQIVMIVFKQYPMFINLAMSLRKMGIPPCITKQTDLLGTFGLGASSAAKSRASCKMKDEDNDNDWGNCEFILDDEGDNGEIDPSDNIPDKHKGLPAGTADSCEEWADIICMW
ncbi:hypothetical protein EDC04DRAFT_2600239 [Pisolithus marmoratus]|nr:hypothetical protein EDC04DRAFT_2600239 [Pisolithus marmoratus]